MGLKRYMLHNVVIVHVCHETVSNAVTHTTYFFLGKTSFSMCFQVFEYDVVTSEAVEVHQPLCEMLCGSKISSLSYNSYRKNELASSDYEGTVTLWDASTCVKVRVFQEHEKRCWSVDFNMIDPKLLASGSDDSKGAQISLFVRYSISKHFLF